MLAYAAMREAYARFQSDGTSGIEPEELFRLYRELPAAAGLDEFYAIEERTTERPS